MTALGNATSGVALLSRVEAVPRDLGVWVLLLAVVILAGAAVLALRRWLFFRVFGPQRGADALRMEQLDRMRDEGLLTGQEYRRARRALLGLPAEADPKAGEADDQQAAGGPGQSGGPERPGGTDADEGKVC